MNTLRWAMFAITALLWAPLALGDDLPGGVTGTVYVQGDSLSEGWVPLEGAAVIVAASPDSFVHTEGSLVVDNASLHPRLQVIGPGGDLNILSRSSRVHRLQAVAESGRRIFSLALTMPGIEVHKTLSEPGLMHITCAESGHGHEQAYVFVIQHRGWALTDARGRYLIADIPPGTWPVQVLSPEIGSAMDWVEVIPARAAEKDLYLIRLDRPPASLSDPTDR